ncbi:hypothetical protein E2C01_053169 [Portunus trituberculatus]|uniref:Uncharacterized protein n=1 Tax=Portunus trituberculatus TaxID=210409 RepID=A0A5B7GRA7_PORTR|nr:hypothetical protein [Portunus trituberculatus]
MWCRQWLCRRQMFGEYKQLLQELHIEDHKGYKNYLRIEPRLFREMVD